MQEQLLHFIWHRKLFNQEGLRTTLDQPVEIIHTGIPNHDQGPDFLQSRIRIDEQLWAGHVEIHVRSSEWYMHLHDKDAHYNNVILHVVWQEDQPVLDTSGNRIPCIELAGRVEHELLERYTHLMNNEEWVPCASSLSSVPEITRTSWLERLMTERLESKTDLVSKILVQCTGDWEQAFFVVLARQLGAPANSDSMENLAMKIPLTMLRKHGDRIDQIEAMLFGVAGMLTKDLGQGYPTMLRKEFEFLKNKYGLQPMPALRWKFMRMRPVHFPTIRIAQLAIMIARIPQFITLLTELTSPEQWMKQFMIVPENEYWKDHYHFKNASPSSGKRLGKDTAVYLIINLVAPFLFIYGKIQGLPLLKEKALSFLSELPAEKNAIIEGWKLCGWTAENAGQTQAMLHLKKNYCDTRRCLHCAIGLKVLK